MGRLHDRVIDGKVLGIEAVRACGGPGAALCYTG
jgi:hypothetical protein